MTESGKKFHAWAEQILASRQQMLDQMLTRQQDPTGHIRVAIDALVAAFYLPDIVRSFSADYPRITISVETCDDPPSLLDGRADLAIHAGPRPADELHGQRAYEYRRWLIAAPNYLSQFGVPKTPYDLHAHHCLTHNTFGSRSWGFRSRSGDEVLIEVTPYVETNSWLLLRTMVNQGLGIMLMGDTLAEADVRGGLVVPILEEFEITNAHPNGLSVWVVHAGKQRPMRLQIFADFIVRHLRGSVMVREPDDERLG